MIPSILVSLLLAEAIAQPSYHWHGVGRRRRTPPPTPRPPTPAPVPPAPDPRYQCEWWKNGMTWDCGCKSHSFGCISCGRRKSHWPSWKGNTWWFSPCSRKGMKCNWARRRKKFTSLCGNEYLGETGAANKNFGGTLGSRFRPDQMAIARFTIDLNQPEDAKNGAKYKYFWGDDNESIGVRWGWMRRGNCSPGYQGGGRCKCTCVWGKSMMAHGDMKAMLPYRGPGDKGKYKRPAQNGGWDDRYGKHNAMYSTYCIGVCGADCDGPKFNGRHFGRNKMYAVLVAHDVCQAYIGSKDPANVAGGVRNGCGDEVYARNWKDATSPNSQGAKAAGSALNQGGGYQGLSCDAGG